MRVTFRCDPALIETLVRPVPARQTLPGWLRHVPPFAYSEVHGQDIRTVKHCPPFIDAMAHGFVIPLPCDVTMRDGVLAWDWELPPLSVEAHPRSPLSFHVPAQLTGTPFYTPNTVAVKFNSFWTMELEPGYSLLATHPVNRFDLPFRLLTGLVDCDRFSDVGVLFPALWTDPEFSGTLPRGTPVAQCFALERTPLDLSYEAFTPEYVKRYEDTAAQLLSRPGIYRRRFRARRGKSRKGLPQTPLIEP